jgi:hypothetical protein
MTRVPCYSLRPLKRKTRVALRGTSALSSTWFGASLCSLNPLARSRGWLSGREFMQELIAQLLICFRCIAGTLKSWIRRGARTVEAVTGLELGC